MNDYGTAISKIDHPDLDIKQWDRGTITCYGPWSHYFAVWFGNDKGWETFHMTVQEFKELFYVQEYREEIQHPGWEVK
jgi:hypothetical protein